MITKKFPNNNLKFKGIHLSLFIIAATFCLWYLHPALSEPEKRIEEAIIVNGDNVEYVTDSREIVAQGNVSVLYKGTKLICRKLAINTQTKKARAEGDVRIEDEKGVVEGDSIVYDFQNKTGTINNAKFIADPYFGKSVRLDKVSEKEFVGHDGYTTTCDLDPPHYRIKSKKMNVFPGDKIQTKNNYLFIGKVPFLYLPRYSHSLKDPMFHMQVSPGKSKDWGPYVLTATRFNLSDNIDGRIYLDYRNNLGNAQGFGANYHTQELGKGNFKFYYSHERATKLPQNTPSKFERYLIRWRHKWDLDTRTNMVSEYYKIVDSKRMILGSQYNLLKDYFYREYEKDSQPLSYALFHHSFDNSGLDILVQKRTNRWYSQLEKLPEIKYSLPSLQIGSTPFYLDNNSSAANFNYKYAVPSESTNDINFLRFDTINKLFLPSKIAFLQFTPFVSSRQTYYDKDVNGSSLPPRTIFYTGADLTTKFFRIFDVRSNFMGMDINGLRHIITPTLGYAYNHKPSIESARLKQIDSVDNIDHSNLVNLELSNKLQTKRKDRTIDFADLRINTSYKFKPIDSSTGDKSGGSFTDFLFNLKLLPYSWMRINADATYNHKTDSFTSVNSDFNFDLGKERSLGFGQRYQRKGGKELTFNTRWRINPKWKIEIYERYQIANYSTTRSGFQEQQYTITRDLHCWEMDVSYSIKRESGNTIWFIFRLKAFPEMEFNFNQNYRAPKSGAK